MKSTRHVYSTSLPSSARRRGTLVNRVIRMLGRAAGLIPVAALLLLTSGCQLADMARFSYANANATHDWSGDQRTTTVPFTLIDNHIILPVQINGSETLQFVLDSGAGATVIMDSRSIRALDLAMAGELPVSGVGDGPDPVARVVPDTDVSLGNLSLRGSSVIFLPLDSVPFFADLDHVYFDGVIGAPFFSRFVTEIDYDRQLISFTEPALASQRLADLGDDWREVPLQIESGVPHMTAQIDTGNGQLTSVKLVVDTGFRGALSLTPETHDRLDEPPEYFLVVDQGLSGDVVSHVAMSESLTLAGYRMAGLPVGYAMAGGESENGSNGLLGNELLQRFNLVFDYGNERLYLRPNKRFDDTIAADRSGLQIRPHTAGGMVRRIDPVPGAGSNPLQVGDIITSFDDTPVSYQSIKGLKRALASQRDSVRLCWLSGATQRCEDLSLASRFTRP